MRVVRYMREATIVPEHEVADAPALAINKFILKVMCEQVVEQHIGIRFVAPLADDRMLRVCEERLATGLRMGAGDWMCNRQRPGPLIVIQPAPEFSLRVISPRQKNTTSPLQRPTEPSGNPSYAGAY